MDNGYSNKAAIATNVPSPMTQVQMAIKDLADLVDAIRAEKDKTLEAYRISKTSYDADLSQVIDAAEVIGQAAAGVRSQLRNDLLSTEQLEQRSGR